MPELVFFRRGEEVLRFHLEGTRCVLGRGERCDVVIPDPSVSRQQVELNWSDGKATARDLSGNGTTIGGVTLSQTELVDGADIALGQWRALFREASTSAAEDGPTAPAGQPTEIRVDGRTLKASEGRPSPVQLRVRKLGDGPPQEQLFKLSSAPVTLGHDPGNDVVLADRFVSGRHLKITPRGARFHLTDLASTNGTFIGTTRIFEAEVPAGTAVRVGETELSIETTATARKEHSFEGIIGNDASVRGLADIIERVAPSAAAVTILGESGTGKELVAKAIRNRSARGQRAFIPVNCAAISKELIESELFGHEKGAFTGAAGFRKGAFEEADGGTLFLDEIGELPLDLQAKLLRALESGEIKRVGASRPMTVDVRIVCATNRDLLQRVTEGRFREDLYYRLCVVPVHLSPLRNRRSDVPALAAHFLQQFAPRGQPVRLTPAALERLSGHHWPGNIRELRNVIHRALLLRRGPMIDTDDLTFDQQVNPETGIAVPEYSPGLTLEQIMEKLERQVIEQSLKKFNHNRERVAKELGVARSTLFKRLKEWGLTRQDEAE